MATLLPDPLCTFLKVARGTKMIKEKVLALIEGKLDDNADCDSVKTQQRSVPQQDNIF